MRKKSTKKKCLNKTKVNKNQIQKVPHSNWNMSDEHMIQIQEEAYYRAIRRVEQEKSEIVENQLTKSKKNKWYFSALLILNVVLCPWKISKRFDINNRLYDSLLVMIVSGAMQIVGALLWITGMLGVFATFSLRLRSVLGMEEIRLEVGAIAIVFGSMLYIAGDEFGRESDSNKIYAYSASIIALISCIVGIITLSKM